MQINKKHKKFLKLPEFPGGKKEFENYIKMNLIYPKEALENKIEGTVFLTAEIQDNGNVENIRIEKNLGYGCDEEATRLLNSCKFGSVKNRGVRVKSRRKFRINFRLPKPKNKIKYSFKKKTEDSTNNINNPQDKFIYTIKL